MSQHEQTIRGSTGARGESSKLGWSLRYQRGEGWWRQWCMSGCLPVPDALILHYRLIFCSCVFKDSHDISQATFFSAFSFPGLYNRVPRSSMKTEVTHCLADAGLLWLLVSGGGRVGREAVSHLEFPVWVLGKLLGIPILIRNFLFQLRSFPDKLEPHTRCVINSSLRFCSFEAPCNNTLWTCSAETAFGFF